MKKWWIFIFFVAFFCILGNVSALKYQQNESDNSTSKKEKVINYKKSKNKEIVPQRYYPMDDNRDNATMKR